MTIYAIDFDGTIVENKYPRIGKLNQQAYDFIKNIKIQGDKWILYTMREGKPLEKAVKFLKGLEIEPDAVNDNLPEMKSFFGNNPRKIFANVYIDDHNAGGLVFSEPVNKQAKNK